MSWALTVQAGERNIEQAAYKLQAATTAEKLAASQPDLWDSGRAESVQPGCRRYAGRPLVSAQRVYWRVRLRVGTGEPGPWSEPAWFETGLLKDADWTGPWVGLDPKVRGDAAACLRGGRVFPTPVGMDPVDGLQIGGHRVCAQVETFYAATAVLFPSKLSWLKPEPAPGAKRVRYEDSEMSGVRVPDGLALGNCRLDGNTPVYLAGAAARVPETELSVVLGTDFFGWESADVRLPGVPADP